ncbi:MAG: signal peptide peptidase SppA [Myxococcota bacterium]|nr:signal peptide peptidase SppA [Myxococcota bacterium]
MGMIRRLSTQGRRFVGRCFLRSARKVQKGSWIEVDLARGWPERTQTGGPAPVLGLTDLLRVLEAAGEDTRIHGVLIRLRGSGGSFASALSLGRAITQLRTRGRRVAVWAEGLSDAQYLALCGADRIWLPESGTLSLLGLHTERFYFRDLLDRVGARPEVVHVGRYKSAGDSYSRDSMSNEEREQLESWQQDVFDELVEAVSRGRELGEGLVRDLIDGGPYPARMALDSGLIDGLGYFDEIPQRLEAWMREDERAERGARRFSTISALRYFLGQVADPGPISLWREPFYLASLTLEGSVQRGKNSRGITSEGTAEWVEALRTDARIRGVLLRIDSPGGDALASDLIHREIERLRKEKPVVVSMGDVAASGGYYIAAPADAIFAEVGTITGSIGVLGMKLNLSGLYERLGITKEGVQKGARAGLFSESHGLSSDERSALRQEMEAFYATFLKRVGRGRQMSTAEVEPIAQGRIWSGRRAQAVGLVDHLGGPLEALKDLAERAGLAEGEPYLLVTLPPVSRFNEWVRSLLSGQGPFSALPKGNAARIR